MSDFSVYTAETVADWMSQGVVASPPSNLFVALFDDTGTEVSGSFANDRPSTAAGTDWTVVATGFENAGQITFGEATADVANISEVALFDANLATGGNEIARYAIDNAPFDVSSGTILRFNAGDLSFDVVDRTE